MDRGIHLQCRDGSPKRGQADHRRAGGHDRDGGEVIAGFIIKQNRPPSQRMMGVALNHYDFYSLQGASIGHAREQVEQGVRKIGRLFVDQAYRRFRINFYNAQGSMVMYAVNQRRVLVKRMDIYAVDQDSPLGSICGWPGGLRLAMLDPAGQVILKGKRCGFGRFEGTDSQQCHFVTIQRKWRGVMDHMLSDDDEFSVRFHRGVGTVIQRTMVLVSAIFIDIHYFERSNVS